MSEVTIEVMMGEDLEDVIQDKYGPNIEYSVLSSYHCDKGGGCDYCTCYVVQINSDEGSNS
ncbi:hypothetical protein [Methylomonas methanica]|uniref:Uncharacterized protein n=1 Tax=Methylomonas methanica (strain DSM 25384 / MC09) TaxID=857087 RepID=F9ZWM3_METMM|nr:hypothetical protein [Methylomonas methanica]AEG00870.1 hypothetical protein Metme_2473 [Methylomonas methanica MC09]